VQSKSGAKLGEEVKINFTTAETTVNQQENSGTATSGEQDKENKNTGNNEKNTTGGQISGIKIAGIVIILLLIGLEVYIRYKRKNK